MDYAQTQAADPTAAWAAYNEYGYGNQAGYGYGTSAVGAYPVEYQQYGSGSFTAWPSQTLPGAEAQPPVPGADASSSLVSQASGAVQPPLPLDEAPGVNTNSASDTSASTTTAAAISSTPTAITATATTGSTSAYDQAAAYQQYYSYYQGYGAYPQVQDASAGASYGAYVQAQAAAAGAAYAQAQAAAAGAAYPYPQSQATTGTASAYASYPQGAGHQAYPGAQQLTIPAAANTGVTSTTTAYPVSTSHPPGPRPPPGSPPKSTGATRQNSSNSYNAVPPPMNKLAINSIRPQYNVRPTAGMSIAGAASGAKPTPAFVQAGPMATPKSAAVSVSATFKKTPAAGPGSQKFPPAFNAWVERCFERCRSDAERQVMTGKLTNKIKYVEQAGRMWLMDWDKEPIPDITVDDSLPSPSSQGSYGQAGGLCSKRSRWEESAPVQQQQQQGLGVGKASKKQQQNAKKQKQQPQSPEPVWSRAELNKRASRAGRFGNGRARQAQFNGYESDDDTWGSDDDGFAAAGVVVQGTSTNLEKSYFRLTGPPDPKEVRPPAVLQKALDRLVLMMRKGTATPFYAVDQFKGLRQDCTVQHLRNELAVAVYEAHARASLEYGDLAEFNQCQTQLAALYADGVPGCVAEFNAYKLLYNLAHARSGANKALLHTLRSALTFLSAPATGPVGAADAADPQCAVANALKTRTAVAAADYPGFFTAYAACPNLGRAILDVLAPHVRWSALNVLVKSYKTNLPLTFVAQALGFVATKAAAQTVAATAHAAEEAAGAEDAAGAEQLQRAGKLQMAGCRHAVYVGKAAAATTEEEGVKACEAWLQAHGAVLETVAETGVPQLDVKSSLGKLFVPEEPKVSHGDENLSLEDFLSRASGLGA